MATVRVCDICGANMQEKDTEAIDFGKSRIAFKPMIFRDRDWQEADICRYCRLDTCAAQDDRPKQSAWPFYVMMPTASGAKARAAFRTKEDADLFNSQIAVEGKVSKF